MAAVEALVDILPEQVDTLVARPQAFRRIRFAEEIQIHIAQETQQRLVEDEGLHLEEATARSRRSFGNVTQALERFYEGRRIAWAGACSTRRRPR